MIIEKRKFALCGGAGGSQLFTSPGSRLPSGLLILMTRLYHLVSQLCQQLSQQRSDAFCVTLCKQDSSSSQKAHTEIVLLTLSRLSLNAASWFRFISNRSTPLSLITYFNGKRKFFKDTIHLVGEGSSLCQIVSVFPGGTT